MNARSVCVALLAFAVLGSARLSAQADSDPPNVRTFPLKYLSNSDAAKLVSPYAQFTSSGSGVFEAGSAVHAITVRAPQRVLLRVDSLLKANDRPRPTIVLRLQLIVTSDSAVSDPDIAAIGAELHNLFRFKGYRLLSQNTAQANEGASFLTTMRGDNGDVISVTGQLENVRREAPQTVQLSVRLTQVSRQVNAPGGVKETAQANQPLLNTVLTIPVGQTVVVGGAISGGLAQALILTIRPEFPSKP